MSTRQNHILIFFMLGLLTSCASTVPRESLNVVKSGENRRCKSYTDFLSGLNITQHDVSKKIDIDFNKSSLLEIKTQDPFFKQIFAEVRFLEDFLTFDAALCASQKYDSFENRDEVIRTNGNRVIFVPAGISRIAESDFLGFLSENKVRKLQDDVWQVEGALKLALEIITQKKNIFSDKIIIDRKIQYPSTSGLLKTDAVAERSAYLNERVIEVLEGIRKLYKVYSPLSEFLEKNVPPALNCAEYGKIKKTAISSFSEYLEDDKISPGSLQKEIARSSFCYIKEGDGEEEVSEYNSSDQLAKTIWKYPMPKEILFWVLALAKTKIDITRESKEFINIHLEIDFKSMFSTWPFLKAEDYFEK